MTHFDMTIEEFIQEHNGLIGIAINHFKNAIDYNSIMSIEDARQYALLGLWKAYEKFDPSYGIKITTMAMAHMKGEILHGFREYDSGAGVKFSRTAKELSRKYMYNKEPGELTPEYLQDVQEKEKVSDYIMECALDYYYHCLYGVVYVDRSINVDGEDVDAPVLDALISHTDEYNLSDGSLIDKFRNTLEDRELIIFDGILADLTQVQIGKKIGVSQMHVSRLSKKLMAKFKEFGERERAYDY